MATKTTTAKKATATKKATPAQKAPAKKATTKAAPKGLGRFDASKVETHKCSGACGEAKPVKAFPTITGTPDRVGECRSCRDKRTKAAKAPAKKATARK